MINKLKTHVITKDQLDADNNYVIEADDGIKSGWAIKAGDGIEAIEAIEADDRIVPVEAENRINPIET